MKRLLCRILVVGVSTSVLWALPAAARGRGGRDVRNPPTANQMVDQADARIAALKANLHLTPDEDKNWGGFQSALHDIAAQRVAQWNNVHEERSVDNGGARDAAQPADANMNAPPPNNATNTNAHDTQNTTNGATSSSADSRNAPSAMDGLRHEADWLNRHADELKKIADAAQPLYASLDDPQRRQLMSFIHRNEAEVPGVPARVGHGRL